MEYDWKVLGLCFIAFFGFFLKPAFFAYDSYASYACVAHGFCETLKWQDGALFIFEILPPNIIFIKFVMLLCFFAAIMACYYIVKRFYSDRTAFLSILFGLALSPIVLFEFAKFENEIFALPFIFWGIYFLLSKNFQIKLYGVAFILFSLIFWMFPGYLLQFKVDYATPIVESTFLAGLFGFFVGILFVPFVFLSKNRWLKFLALVAVGFSLGSGKLAVFLIPFLFLGIAQAIKLVEERGYDLKYMMVVAVFLLFGLSGALFLQQPNVFELEIVEESVEMQNELEIPLYNDWSYGYWLWFFEVRTNCNPGSHDCVDLFLVEKPFLALTEEDLQARGCTLAKSYTSYARRINLYKCD